MSSESDFQGSYARKAGDTLPLKNGTSGNQTIPDTFSIVVPYLYDVATSDMVDIQGDAVLEVT